MLEDFHSWSSAASKLEKMYSFIVYITKRVIMKNWITSNAPAEKERILESPEITEVGKGNIQIKWRQNLQNPVERMLMSFYMITYSHAMQ